ncbi:hypothetical protein E1B28_003488 [Marasmius oreades]|uniref:Pheromone receptor n=1 Tax=Marasmius oreades TaxID=181124 RepID=A0A9P7RN47_9AGAR|nr:uncharacterized protein E1B28_003488 [Marasmius oreades]KAG7085963.1 hypothetical protein E1B28_003488 [Marasmius oreades]
MIVALPVISFLCFGFLCLCLLGPHVRSDVPQLSLILWLIVGNVIHGLNSLIWSGNTDIHVPVWCDIVTKVLIATGFAIPACCLCMAAHLELLASHRPFVTTRPARRARLIFNLTICWIIPVIYSLLHLIVQNHRFDIVRDFGCSAAIHSSIPSVLVVWLPSFLFSVVSFIISGISLHHSFQVSASRFEEHILNRLNVAPSLYLRRITSVFILTIVTITFSVFILFTRSDFRSFAYWEALHAHFKEIFVLGPSPDRSLAKMMWWLIPTVSIAYILLWITVGEDVRDVVKALRSGKVTFPSLPRPVLPKPRSILPIHLGTRKKTTKSRPVYRPQLVAPVLVSGWDEMLDLHAQRSCSSPPFKSSSSSPSTTPTKSPLDPTAHPHFSAAVSERSSDSEGDKKFTISTLEYLTSPAARSLGLTSPVLSSPPPAYRSPFSETSHLFVPSDPFSKSPEITKSIPDDVASTSSSLYDIPWPAPPSIVTESGCLVVPQLRPHSPALSDASFVGTTPKRSTTPPNLRHPPFRGPSIYAIPDKRGDAAPGAAKQLSRTQCLHRELGLSRLNVGIDKKRSAEAIYMTVVTHETREPRAL